MDVTGGRRWGLGRTDIYSFFFSPSALRYTTGLLHMYMFLVLDSGPHHGNIILDSGTI